MALFVNTNVSALNGQKNLMNVTNRMNSSFEKLSSGSRINSAKDDAAGLQIADRLTTQIIGLNQATRNANDAISIAQIAEGALGEVTTNVQRMRQLAVQGGNRTLSQDDRDALGQEFEKLLNVNNDIADRTAFGTMKILNGDAPSAGFQIQSGAQSGEQDTITTGNAKLEGLFGHFAADLNIGSLQISGGGTLSAGVGAGSAGAFGKIVGAYMVNNDVSNVSDALDALISNRNTVSGLMSDMGATLAASITINVSNFTTALTGVIPNSTGTGSSDFVDAMSAMGIVTANYGTLSGVWEGSQLNLAYGAITDGLLDTMTGLVTQIDNNRAKLGAEQNGLSSTIRSNTVAVVNVSDARSRIQDTDFALETAELTRNQIIQQASTSILAQANQLPQAALSLLGG